MEPNSFNGTEFGDSLCRQQGTFSIIYYNSYRNPGFGIILTFLVFLVTDYGGNALVCSLLASAYPAFQLIGAPIVEKWPDLYERKKFYC